MTISFDFQKLVQLLNLFAEKEGGSINRMKAIKLAWLCDRTHLRRYGRTISGDAYYALPYGPIGTEIKEVSECKAFYNEKDAYRDQYLGRNDNPYYYNSLKSVDVDVFSETDLEVIDQIYEQYKSMSQFELKDLSHKYPEWKRFEELLKSGGRQYPMVDEDFFKDAEGIESSESAELIAITKELYNENKALFNLL